MRILRIEGWDGDALGGSQVYIRRVARALEDRGHPNLTAALVTDDPDDFLGPTRVYRIPRSPPFQVASGFLVPARLGRWLDRIAEEFRPDIIHLHHFRLGFLALGPWIARRTEPVVFTVHDVERLCPIGTLTLPDGSECPGEILPRCQFTGCRVGRGVPFKLSERWYFDRYVRSRVRVFVCVSRATRRAFERAGYRPTELLRPMIPVPDTPAPAPEGPFTLGLFGRVDRQKGVEVLLQALALVRRDHPEVRLRIAGNGPFVVPRAPEIVADGWVSDTSAWLRLIHVLVAPSLGWENLGNSPIEALGHGVPVIVSDAGGLPETVDRFGTVVPQGDSEALARALIEVYRSYESARKTALAGRDWVRAEFSPDRHLAKLLGIYSKVLGSAPTRGGDAQLSR